MFYFLDIDGVLNKESDWKRPFTLNEKCLKIFSKLIKNDKDAHIILSSTWRVGCNNRGVLLKNENDYIAKLDKYGIKIENSIPISGKSRQEEIEYYIRRNQVKNYIVLDDDLELFPWPERINLYVINYKTGIREEDVKQICKHINKKMNKKLFQNGEK